MVKKPREPIINLMGPLSMFARQQFIGENCFLQEKIPHFCKDFSPGTGGEFFC